MAESIRNDCDAELTEVNAVIDGALDAIAALTQSEIAAVRGVKTPSVCMKLNMEVICILKNIKPERVQDASGGGNKMVDDYWGPAKRIMGDPKFVEYMSSFDKDNIPAKTAKLIRDKYLSNPEINPDKSKSNLAAMDVCARAMYRWVIAIGNHIFNQFCVSFLKILKLQTCMKKWRKISLPKGNPWPKPKEITRNLWSN